jgi:hypothetical protein
MLLRSQCASPSELVEVAALDQKLKSLGQNSTVEFNQRSLNLRQNEQGDVMGLLGKRSASGKVQKEVTILNKLGLHARPAAMFVRAANKHRAEIWVESVADAGANPTFAAGAIQSAPRSACYEALPLINAVADRGFRIRKNSTLLSAT